MIKVLISLWKNVFNFKGRANRKEFWTAVAADLVFMFLLLVLLILAETVIPVLAIAQTVIVLSICLFPIVSLYVRRANDIGITENILVYIASIIPLLGAIVVSLLPSVKSDNKKEEMSCVHRNMLSLLFTIGIIINICVTVITLIFPAAGPLYSIGISVSFVPVILKYLLKFNDLLAKRKFSKLIAWPLTYEEEIRPASDAEKFSVRDRYIILERKAIFMRFVWLIGGVFCLIILHSGGWPGIIAGLLGMVLVTVLDKIFQIKLSLKLHLICYTKRNQKYDHFIAIDIETNEVFYVQHIFEDKNDENPQTLYGFEPYELDELKQFIKSHSERFYRQIEHISSENIKELCNIQFGETAGDWIKFIIKKEDDIHRIGCLTIRREGVVSAKYTELPAEIFDKTFSNFADIYEKYGFFIKTDFSDPQYNSLCYVDRLLNEQETNKFLQIYDESNNNTNEAENEPVEILFIKDFITEKTTSKNATMRDISTINLLKETVVSAEH